MSKKRLTKTDYLRRKKLNGEIKHDEGIEKIGTWKHKVHNKSFSFLDFLKSM